LILDHQITWLELIRTRRLYQVKYLSKDAPDYDRGFKLGVLKGYKKVYLILLNMNVAILFSTKGVENCIYNTHPDGEKILPR
jgi:hypothetical protein